MTFKERKRRRSAFVTGALAFLVAAAFAVMVLVNHPDGVLGFPHIGTEFSEGMPEEAGGTTGYDGQFVYYIARDGAEAVPYIDGPSFRYQRIMYPVMARGLALWQGDLVPWTLLALNVAALSVGAGVLGYLLATLGASAYYGLLYVIWVGNLFALRFTLTEPLCYTFGLLAILAYSKKRYRWTVLLLVLSVLTKEIGLVVAGGLSLHAVLNRRRWGWGILLSAAPLLAYFLWWQILHLWLGDSPSDYPAANFASYPLQGWVSVLTADYDLEGGAKVVHFILLTIFMVLPTVLFTGLAARHLWQNRRQLWPRPTTPQTDEVALAAAITLPAVAFIAIMPGVSWQDPVAAYRVGLPLLIAGLLLVAQVAPRRMRWLAAYWLPASLIILMIPTLFTGTA